MLMVSLCVMVLTRSHKIVMKTHVQFSQSGENGQSVQQVVVEEQGLKEENVSTKEMLHLTMTAERVWK